VRSNIQVDIAYIQRAASLVVFDVKRSASVTFVWTMADLSQIKLYLLDIRVRPCAHVSDVINGSWKSLKEGVASSGHGRIIHGFKVGVVMTVHRSVFLSFTLTNYQTLKTLCDSPD
jgi:hypothetical protein